MADSNSRRGLRYDTPEILEFIKQTHIPSSKSFDYAIRQIDVHDMPSIQVGPTDGRILQLLMSMIEARKVLELGTLSGYSGLWLLAGMKDDGRLFTIEADAKHAEVANDVFVHAGYGNRVTLINRQALDALDGLKSEAPFDAVFLDADKRNYDRYATWAFDHVRPGGLIIADNAYLFGYLNGQDPDNEWDSEAIENVQRMHRFLAQTCLSVCVPTPDGMLVARKPA
jgi:caffeoyl-CoA O-methyltransferase